MVTKRVPGTNVELRPQAWAASVAFLLVVFTAQLSTILTALANYQALRDGCVKAVAGAVGA